MSAADSGIWTDELAQNTVAQDPGFFDKWNWDAAVQNVLGIVQSGAKIYSTIDTNQQATGTKPVSNTGVKPAAVNVSGGAVKAGAIDSGVILVGLGVLAVALLMNRR